MKQLFRSIWQPVNTITHGIGALLALIASIFVMTHLAHEGTLSQIIAFSTFCGSVVLLYTVSALYHSLPVRQSVRDGLRILDHCMVYLLIAGTYTPVCLLILQGSWKWGLLITICVMAVIGMIKKIFWIDTPQWFSILYYLIMGWLAVIVFPVFIKQLPLGFTFGIAVGGLAYTVGAIIYGLQRPNPIPGWVGSHEIWHVFVMVGTGAHFWSFYQYLL